MTIRGGSFEVDVEGPYPCFVIVRYNNQRAFSIRHTELRDLEFVVKRAIAEARMKLGKDKHEME